MTTLSDETVIVTGASRGLGAAMAKRFTREGAAVVLTARSEDDLQQVAETVSGAPGETLVQPADVTDEQAVRTVVDTAIDRFGELTGLVNNAGIGLLSLYGERRPLHEVETADFRQIIEVNVTGLFLYSKYVVPEFLDIGRGNIINISSGLGRRASPEYGPYVASKWALEGITRTQSMELEDHGINVNSLDPGNRVDTGFWDHLPADERQRIEDATVMNDAATLLLAQGGDGISGQSHPAADWEDKLKT